MQTPKHISKLVDSLRKLPGVGSRSAERFAYHLIDWSPQDLSTLATLLSEIPLRLQACSECGALIEERCPLCADTRRHGQTLCVVATFKDIFAIEATHEFSGQYHVLGGLLSPLDRLGPENLTLPKLKDRLVHLQTQELLLALDSTLEGDTTALWLKRELAAYPIKISRLAFGLPMGSALDIVDGGTLARALQSRREF